MSKRLELIPLGGQEEIGKNMWALRYGSNIILVDCGMKFPEAEMYGVDMVIPDFGYILQHKKDIKAVVLTHAHEDHIGGLPYLFKHTKVPVYGTALTLGLVEEKLNDYHIKGIKLHKIKPRQVINLGPFRVEFLRVCHSIADGVGLVINTPVGTVVHSGDFKIDYTPVDGQIMDLDHFRAAGDKGVLLMLSDSTNADMPGFTESERTVGKNFEEIFARCHGRIIIATFASNIHRVQQVFEVAEHFGRKVAISGRSMQIITRKARELGFLKFHNKDLVHLDDVNDVPAKELVIVTTGSQGEPMSALTRMALGEHKQLKIKKGDTVIISAIPIPGNETYVDRNIDRLFKLGANVIYEQRRGVHVSGHAAAGELKLLLSLVKPKFFIPIHGEYRHLVMHAKLAEDTGVQKKNIAVIENGTIIELSPERMDVEKKHKTKDILIDGSLIGDLDPQTLRERKLLSMDGVMMVSVTLSKKDRSLTAGPLLITRGCAMSMERDEIIKHAENKIREIFSHYRSHKIADKKSLETAVREELGKYLRFKTRQKPIILISILEV